MGVTHKLTDDVAGFILEQKQINPDLSCRKLVSIVFDAFQIKVSKSAINVLLKSAQLSSPVGRPRGFHPESSDIGISATKRPTTVEFSSLPPVSKISSKRKDAHPSGQVFKPKEKKAKGAKPALTDRFRLPDIPLPLVAPSGVPSENVEVHDNKIVKEQSQKQTEKGEPVLSVAVPPARGVLQDGIGAIFLKSAEWALSDKPIFGELMRRHLKGSGLMDLDTAGELLLLMPAFGMRRLDDLALYNRQGLWALCGMKTKINPASIQAIVNEISDLQGLTVSLDVDMPQLFTDVGFIKICLEDSSEFWIDAQHTSIWKKGVPLPFFTSLSKILTGLARNFLNNSFPAIFCNMPGNKEIPTENVDFLLAFENAPGKRMTRMAVCNDRFEEITEFNMIPTKKRHWIAGLWPWQDSFKRLVELEKELLGTRYINNLLKTKCLDNYYYLTEIQFQLAEKDLGYPQPIKLRAILARADENKVPFMAVLTNMDSSKRSGQNVWIDYFSRWPNLENSFNLYTSQHYQPLKEEFHRKLKVNYRDFLTIDDRSFIKHYITGSCGFIALIHKSVEMLNKKCQKLFFPEGYGELDISEMKSRYYDIPGYIQRAQARINAELVVRKDNYLYYNELQFAVTRINESDLFDFQGRKIYIKILYN